MDGVFESDKMRKEQAERIQRYRKLMWAKLYGDKFFSLCGCDRNEWSDYVNQARNMPLRAISKSFIAALLECDYDTSERVGIHCLRTEYEICYWYKEDFEELMPIDFEGIKIPAPKGYDRCLRTKWGNYMEFPPESERGYKHIGDILIHNPDVPYDRYDVSSFTNIFNGIDGKNILLFGAGGVYDTYMEDYGDIWRPECVFDNDERKWGMQKHGIEVKPPKLIKEHNLSTARIIIASYYFDEIERQLENMGITGCYKYIQGRKYH
jgi:lipopolysaccharide cholinephosphotransferase